jgi:sialic acid synthase SpsE
MLIVAEIGVNWNGLAHACRMIIKAKQAGADAVKFQVFKEEHVKGHPRFDELRRMCLDLEDLKILKECADYNEIEFFATPFYVEAVELLEAVGVKQYKIRERDYMNMSLIKKVLATHLPIYVSESRFDSDFYRNFGWERNIHRLYCIPKYPPQLNEIRMPYFHKKERMGLYGYSNHYPGITPALLSVMKGAEYVEIHVMSEDRNDEEQKECPEAYSIDYPVSWTFNELAMFIKLAREMEVIK